jgi:hypothetical protein
MSPWKMHPFKLFSYFAGMAILIAGAIIYWKNVGDLELYPKIGAFVAIHGGLILTPLHFISEVSEKKLVFRDGKFKFVRKR